MIQIHGLTVGHATDLALGSGVTAIGHAASLAMARAVAIGVYEAAALPLPGALPAWRDRFTRSNEQGRS